MHSKMELIKIPAIRGKIGETVFYTANLSYGQISSMLKRIDGDLYISKSYKGDNQQASPDNYKIMSEFFLNETIDFFDSLVLVVEGSTEWREIRFEIEGIEYRNIGLLEFSGDEKIFPIKGQHRVERIIHSVSQNSSLEQETVSVMLIGHSNFSQSM